MYQMMHANVMKRHFKDDVCDYDFDAQWWNDKYVELKNRMNGPVR